MISVQACALCLTIKVKHVIYIAVIQTKLYLKNIATAAKGWCHLSTTNIDSSSIYMYAEFQ